MGGGSHGLFIYTHSIASLEVGEIVVQAQNNTQTVSHVAILSLKATSMYHSTARIG